MACYVNAVRAIVCFELPAREASNFCDFWKLTSCDFHRILLFDWNKLFFLDVLIKEISLPNMCPNMNYFDAVDFNECHSEEVISFFWRSVYIAPHFFPFKLVPQKHLTADWQVIQFFLSSSSCSYMTPAKWSAIRTMTRITMRTMTTSRICIRVFFHHICCLTFLAVFWNVLACERGQMETKEKIRTNIMYYCTSWNFCGGFIFANFAS